MKAFFQAFVGILAAIAMAFAFRYLYTSVLGTNENSATLDEYGTMMLEARGLFLEHSEEIQELVHAVSDMEGICLLRSADGTATALRQRQTAPAQEVLAERAGEDEDPARLADLADTIFAGAQVTAENEDGELILDSHAKTLLLSVKEDAVVLHTGAHEKGSVGILYLAEDAEADLDGVELITLISEDDYKAQWYIFYVMES